MVFGEFRQRFQGLLPPSNQPSKDADMKQVTVHPSVQKNMSTDIGRKMLSDCHIFLLFLKYFVGCIDDPGSSGYW